MTEPPRRGSGSGALVDSNVVIDILGADPTWRAWSRDAVARARTTGPVVINELVYAEVSTRYSSAQELDAALPRSLFGRIPLPWAAAFMAGQAFVAYRRSGGVRRSPLPDFYIGAHAAVMDLAVITRDAARYRTYFPSLTVIAPD